MTKKARTTGVPRQKKLPVEVAAEKGIEKKTYETQAEREARIQRWLVRITLVALTVVIVLVGATLLVDQVIIPNQAVAVVNGDTITVREFQNRVKFERARIYQLVLGQLQFLQSLGFDENSAYQQLQQFPPYSTYINELNFPDQLGRRGLDDIINDRLIKQKAAELNIALDEAAVDEQINEYFGYDPTQVALIGVEPTATLTPTISPTPFVSPTPTSTPTETPTLSPEQTEEATLTPQPTIPPSPTASAEEVQQNFKDTVSNINDYIRSLSGVGQAEIDDFFERSALRAALRDAVITLENPLPHVNARHILVASEEEALDVKVALENGESFSDLARAVSDDTGSGSNGGELGWTAVQNFVKPFRDAVMEAPIGEIIGPVETDFGFHIIQVRAREDRDVEEAQLDQLKENVFADWLEEQRESAAEGIQIFDIWIDHIPQ
jgi:hypothetical protein